MKFLYPYFNTNTHQISGSLGVSIQYPDSAAFDVVRDYPTPVGNVPNEPPVEDPSVSLDGTRVCVIREHTGYKSKWSLVKVIDPEYQVMEYYGEEFYVLTEKLINIGDKESYSHNHTNFSAEDRKAIEINPVLKETFIPYIDKYNGFYSVRIQVSYEKVLDMKLFKTLVEQVYQEGISILLAGRGYSSGNDTIKALTDKYYTFGYVQNDLDLTKRRMCEPITFTVSMPLNFFDGVASNRPSLTTPGNVSNIITFTNKDFVTKIDNIMLMLSEKDKDIERELFPNKRLSNYYGVSSELTFIKHFAVAMGDMMASVECPISPNEPLTTYQIGMNNSLDIIFINVKKQFENNTQEITFNEGLLAACRLEGKISNKRILNYFINYQNMITDMRNMKSVEFFIAYTSFPPVMFEDDNITIKGQNFTPEQVKQFRMAAASKTEQCFSLDQGIQVAKDIGQLASDPAFHLFSMLDPKNTPSVDSITKQVSKNLEYLQKSYNQLTASSEDNSWYKPITNIVGTAGRTFVELTGSFEGLDKDYLENKIVNYWYPKGKDGKYDPAAFLTNFNLILKRLKIEEIILSQIICNLKGTPFDDPSVREIISKLPEQVINFFLLYTQGKGLAGAAWVAFVEEGNYKASFCTPDELVLVLKVVANLAKGVNTFSKNTVNFIKEVDGIVSQYSASQMSGKAYNPYKAIITGVVDTIYNTVINLTFDYVKSALTAVCDDDLFLDQTDNFSSPLGTHAPIQATMGSVNNDPDILKANIANAMDQSIPYIIREMRYGSDLEYTVDLISLLIEDVKCILTPRESIDLLMGQPTEECVVIIKNIIRNKYNKDPNNLSYLLDEEKLKMFFKKLGYTVDSSILNQVTTAIPYVEPGDLCSPEQLKYREIIINETLPVDLDILKEDIKRRVERAKTLFEKLDSEQPIKNISALCPDNESPDINRLKSDIVKQYMDSIKSMFSPTLTSFTTEAAALPQTLAEEKVLTRRDKNGTLFEGFKYNNFYSNLGKNLKKYMTDEDAVTGSVQTKFIKSDTSVHFFKTLYKNYNSSPVPKWQLEDMFLKTETAKLMTVQEDKCASGSYSFETDEIFKKFLSEGRIIWENRPWDRKWGNIDKEFSERGGGGAWESEFSYELRTEHPELYNYIKEKEYVLFISSETVGQIDTYPWDVDSKEKVPAAYRRLIDAEAGLSEWMSTTTAATTAGIVAGAVVGTFAGGPLGTAAGTIVGGGIGSGVGAVINTATGGALNIKNAAEKIVFRLVRYSSPDDFTDQQTKQFGDFKLLQPAYVEDIENTTEALLDEEKLERLKRRKRFRINFSNYTSEIISNLQYDREGEELIATDKEFYTKYYPDIKVFNRLSLLRGDPDATDWVRDKKRYSSYVINDRFLDIANMKDTPDGAEFRTIEGYDVPVGFDNPIETLNMFQKTFTEVFKEKIEQINKFDKLFRSSEKFQKNGIFNIVTTINNNNSIITKDVFIPSTLEDNDLDYARYYSIPFKKTIEDDYTIESYLVSKGLYNFVYKKLNYESQLNLGELTPSWQTFWMTKTRGIENVIQQEVDAIQTEQAQEQIRAMSRTDFGLSIDRTNFESGVMEYVAPNVLDVLKRKTYIKDIEVDVTNEQTITQNESYKLIPEVVFVKPPDFFNHTSSIVKIESLIDFEFSVKDPEIKMIKNMDYQDPYLYNYSKYSKLDISKDLRYKNCNLYPHYLNLEYFVSSISKGAADKLCDSNLNEIPKDVLKEILFNLTIRANVTDTMVKLIPLLSLFNIEQLLMMHTKQEIIDILRTHIARDMSTLTSNLSLEDPNNYYNIFTSTLNQFYSENKNILKINDRFKLPTAQQKNLHLDALICREIKHFINFCLDSGVFYPSETSIVDDFKSSSEFKIMLIGLKIPDDKLENYIWIELYGLMIYLLMASTVDSKKRGIFSKTKVELFSLFYKTASLLNVETVDIAEKSEEDIIKFINGLSNSGNPSSLTYTNQQTAKYINFFMQATRQQAKSILGTVAMQTEQNMFFTKLIQTTLGFASNTTWSLLDDKIKNKSLMETYVKYYKESGFEAGVPSINSESAYTLKRISEGKSPLADFMVSFSLAGLGFFAWNLFPGVYTLAYDAIDIWEYAEWRTKSHEEIKKAVEGFLAGREVCQVSPQEIKEIIACEDNYETLVNEMNKHEEM